MKKVCLMFNHLRHQDGVGRSAIAIANWLTRMKLAEVTLIPIYTNDMDCHSLLEPDVKVHPVFGLWFHGMPHIVDKIPLSWINNRAFKEDYDVMVGFQYGLSIRCIAVTSRRSHASKYAWMHGYDEGLNLRREYEAIGKVVCVSRCNSERLHQDMPTIITDYSYNPIDEKLVQLNGEEPIDIERPTDRLLFVTVGRMSSEKGFERLLRICKRLKDEGRKYALWLIGDGPDFSKLKLQMKDFELDDCVRFLGRQSNPHKYTAKADVFVCSSYSEGYSTACTEAIMLGIPVITTNVSGAEEITEEAECGKMVGMDDESLYQAMREVLTQPKIIDQWKNKLQSTRERFYAKTRIQRLVDILGLNNN